MMIHYVPILVWFETDANDGLSEVGGLRRELWQLTVSWSDAGSFTRGDDRLRCQRIQTQGQINEVWNMFLPG